MESAPSRPTPKRKYHSKSKKGCRVCKLRRVKCDETRPSCQRCLTAGWACEYLPDDKDNMVKSNSRITKFLPKPTSNESPESALSEYSGSIQDYRYFSFFRAKTAPLLSCYSIEGFWKCDVLQASHAEPAVKHALLAIAASHELVLKENSSDQTASRTPQKNGPSTEVFLIACTIFFYAEIMLGNVEGALNHLHSGTQILSSWKSNLQKRNSSRTLRDLIEENVIPIFSYLNCASFVTGRTIPAWLITEQDTQFKDAKEARQSFLKLMELMEKFSSAMQKLTILSPGNKYSGLRLHVPDDMLSMKYRLLLRAQQWSDALKSLQETADLSPRDTSIISMLELQHKIASIWISKAFDCTEETSWDAFVSDFEAFIVATDQMYMYGEMGCGNSQFQIELRQWQIFGLLFITAVKCRNPGIRRRALAMMAKSRKGEGNCNSQPMNEHVKRVIGLEEEGLNELRDPIGDVVPDEWARLTSMYITPEMDRVKNGLRVVFCRNLDNMDQLRIPGNYVLSNVTDRGTVGEPRGYQEVLVKL